MQIISGTTEFECDMNTAAAIGKFDGVHLGHRRLLEKYPEGQGGRPGRRRVYL